MAKHGDVQAFFKERQEMLGNDNTIFRVWLTLDRF